MVLPELWKNKIRWLFLEILFTATDFVSILAIRQSRCLRCSTLHCHCVCLEVAGAAKPRCFTRVWSPWLGVSETRPGRAWTYSRGGFRSSSYLLLAGDWLGSSRLFWSDFSVAHATFSALSRSFIHINTMWRWIQGGCQGLLEWEPWKCPQSCPCHVLVLKLLNCHKSSLGCRCGVWRNEIRYGAWLKCFARDRYGTGTGLQPPTVRCF